MNELTKSLTDLIDETLSELEELKKSRFSAETIEIKGPGEGIAGKPVDGKLDAAKAEDKDEEDDEDEDADKADMSKKDDDKKDDKKDDEESPEHEAKEKSKIKELADMHDMKKSQDEMSSLMKSYIDQRISPLESKLSTIVDLVTKMADQPVSARGATARMVPLMKSIEEAVQPMSKAQIADKLFELKKSGTVVDSLDVTKAEMGQDLSQIVSKYKLS